MKPDGKKTDWLLVYERLENGDIKLIATGDHKDIFTETGRNLRAEIYSILNQKGEMYPMNKETLKQAIVEKLHQNKKDEEDLSWMIESTERTKMVRLEIEDFLRKEGEL